MIKHFLFMLMFLFAMSSLAQEVTVDVTLTPAGDFTLTPNKVTGFAVKKGDQVIAENVIVELKGLTTGLALRDKHTKDKLQVKKFPHAKLVKAIGKGGKGKAKVEIMGKEKEVKGTYKVSGKTLKAKFKIHLPDFGFEGISYMGVGVDDDVNVNVTLPIK